MRRQKMTTKIKILIPGLIFGMLLSGIEVVNANEKPKISKIGAVVTAGNRNQAESQADRSSDTGVNPETFREDDQEVALVISEWVANSAYWSADDLSSNVSEKQQKDDEYTDRDLNLESSAGGLKSLILFDAHEFIPNSEF